MRKDGTVIDVSISVSPIHDAAGTITGAATVARDITERNRAADQIRAYQDQINRAERLETVGQLAGGIAHDVNNMVGAIIGFAELITTETDNRAAVIHDAKLILASAQRAGRLTKELLTISRRLPAQPKPSTQHPHHRYPRPARRQHGHISCAGPGRRRSPTSTPTPGGSSRPCSTWPSTPAMPCRTAAP